MRQRKAKDLDRRLAECRRFIAEKPSPQYWNDTFPDAKDIYAEIGCGKGDFIIQIARRNGDCGYVAIEGQETVILRALEKAQRADEEEKLNNLKFVTMFVDNMKDIFEENQLTGLYLNFSDPWPKARHARRRLTHRIRLENYRWAIRKGGFLEFKTDNDALFQFTMNEIEAMDYNVTELTHDLHNSSYESQYTMTEYEAKFKEQGKNIHYVRLQF